MSSFFDYAAVGAIGLIVLGGVFLIASGLYLAKRGEKYRAGESPWTLITRNLFSVFAGVLIFLAYMDGRIDGFWTIGLCALVELPGAVYRVWNDHKYAMQIGAKIPFDLSKQ